MVAWCLDLYPAICRGQREGSKEPIRCLFSMNRRNVGTAGVVLSNQQPPFPRLGDLYCAAREGVPRPPFSWRHYVLAVIEVVNRGHSEYYQFAKRMK